jgi:hypothetical protein
MSHNERDKEGIKRLMSMNVKARDMSEEGARAMSNNESDKEGIKYALSTKVKV